MSSSEAIVFKDSDTVLMKSMDSAFEIPRPILNLAKAHIQVPLTLLTRASLWKIHADPSIIKMMKGLVLDNLELSVMDVSAGFLAETTLTGDKFYEAYRNFLKILKLIADDATVKCFKDHRDFCLLHDKFTDDFTSVLNFDIKTRRKFFNNQTFHHPDAYLQRWNKVKINTSLHPSGALSQVPNTNHYSFLNTRKTSNKYSELAPVEVPTSASVPISFTNRNPNPFIPLVPITTISEIPEYDFLSQAIKSCDITRTFQNLSAAATCFMTS
ncbi:hypothetical protein DFJ58DRAFT_734497 [Suillus subalutaceus]|uniref:uncharacterized protein n=1 Tax=Suillus subalutaceus TaxID=48586 RepID=UPI001B86A099|nr:uncharacterized protein DFJ58DRAFT_734497 [Suillus subalutaceus]KAG1837227.1 hypothetical protein DFJ58DRAFT_734497 [Suillus subalutaceus]